MAGNRNKRVESVTSTSKDKLPEVEHLQRLKASCPNAVFFTLIPRINNDETDSADDEDFLPRPLTALREDALDVGNGDIDIKTYCRSKWDRYECSEEQIRNLEAKTRNQSASQLWFEHRKGRITGSKAHDVFVHNDNSSNVNLVKMLMGYKMYELSKNKAVMWGVENEDCARQLYCNVMSNSHDNFVCVNSGFVIDKLLCFVGASPDGCISCSCHGKGVLEIKCPMKHKDAGVLYAAQNDKSFCLTLVDENLELKRSHRYFTQTQMQNACMQR